MLCKDCNCKDGCYLTIVFVLVLQLYLIKTTFQPRLAKLTCSHAMMDNVFPTPGLVMVTMIVLMNLMNRIVEVGY